MLKIARLAFALATIGAFAAGGRATAQESGYLIIRGTRVFTQMNHAAGVATFSNDCGSQTLTQRQLQNGAIPDEIIPCPRPSAGRPEPRPAAPAAPAPQFTPQTGLHGCPAGEDRYSGGACAPIGVNCGHSHCLGSDVCVDHGAGCTARTSPRVCADGRAYCEIGFTCGADNKCHPTAAQNPAPAPGSSPGGAGAVSDSCLIVEDTKVVSGSIGECQKKGGGTGHYNFTFVHSSMKNGCPKEIDFQYLDPDTGQTESFSTPFNVQLCDVRPVRITVTK